VANLLVFGAGYTGLAIACLALAEGMAAVVASRSPDHVRGVPAVPFDGAAEAIARADAIVATAPPGPDGDPVLRRWGEAIATGPARWLGYLSTTGVYGDRGGAWVDENTEPAPGQARSRRRLEAENAWCDAAAGRPLDIIRLAGIYGPGRSALDEVRSGRARRVIKPGHAFGRIHRDDIARGVLAAIRRPAAGARVLNFADDMPAESAEVIAEAARLLGAAMPPAVPFEDAVAGMGDMARSFWSENRRVSNAKTKAALGLSWLYPDYRAGLVAILSEEQKLGARATTE
jgi:nucleoside-diphosphate-sugar epimerase